MKTNIPAKPAHVQWTDDQWKAILAKDQDVLVAAAAGSGKTAVLVERIIQKILSDKDPLDVDQLLVVTFTNAAAAEMRYRIGEELAKAIDGQPGSSHLKRQLSLLNMASISTLHSFCLEIVQKYYYLVDIDPGFRIADDTENSLIRDEVLESLFEYEYGLKENESFYQLVDTFTGDRSDAELQELVLKLYDFSRSHPNPDLWLDAIIDMYDIKEGQTIEDLPFFHIFQTDIQMMLTAANQLLTDALDMTKLPGGPAPRAENYVDDLAVVERLQRGADEGWEALYEQIGNMKFTRAKVCRGDEYDQDLVKEADSLRKQARGILDTMKIELFSKPPASFLRDMKEMRPIYARLIELVKTFSSRYSEVKAEKGLVDFSDLEHFALQILANNSGIAGMIQPSDIAYGYRSQFKEVLIDEYQDVNMVQETIIRLITKDDEYNGNLFMVGDVKQSIYRFRLAEPNLFLGKYRRFSREGHQTGLRIDLAKNFRSRKEILDGTNFIFKQIMDESVGEIEYNEDAELVQGAGYPEEHPFPIEVAIIDRSNKKKEETNIELGENEYEELEQTKLEARYLARRIRSMIDEGHPVYNIKSGSARPAQYRDIVVLLRSMTWAADIIDEFKHEGIPVYADLSTGYFEATEVTVMMSLLKIIDNPDQDIPLASVLRSPIIGMDEEALAQIRVHSKSGSFYSAVKEFAETENQFFESERERTAQLLNNLHRWRNMARNGSLSELIWQLYRDTGFYEFAGGLPGGKQRQANLRALYDRARQYEETSFRGLFRFLRFIDRMRDRGSDLGAARALGEQEDVVRIMTIHSSKGLEFPIVFAAGLGRKFNMRDLQSSTLFDKEYGFASKYINAEKRLSYPSLAQLAFKRKKKMELLAEEMRVLYVAMTRAKEKLILVGTVKNAEKAVNEWVKIRKHHGWLLQDYDRARADSYLDWIGRAIIRHKDSITLNAAQHGETFIEHPSKWKIDLIGRTELELSHSAEGSETGWLTTVKKREVSEIQSPMKDEVYRRLGWKYAYSEATKRMSKQSVTELKRLTDMRDEVSATDLLQANKLHLYDKPAFMESKSALSPAERGTAMHTVMQHISIDELPTLISIEELLDDLIHKEILTVKQADAVSAERILQFFNSELGMRMRRASVVEREVPFTFGMEAGEIYSDWRGGEEKVIIQGIVDCIIKESDGLILIDYKTDTIQGRFPGGFQQAHKILENRYRVQIDLYERAIEEIWKKQVNEKYLYFFDGGHTLKM